MLQDIEDFKADITWFIKPADIVSVKEGTLIVSDAFKSQFPILHKLISAARVLDVTINDNIYRLLSWTKRDGTPCGWLCKTEPADVSTITIFPEHQLLLNNMGGIKESYNQPDGVLTNNQNFLFIKSLCRNGLDGWEVYYLKVCQEEDIAPMPTTDLVTFVQEANGNVTVYNRKSGQVYLFAHDHSFDNVTFLEGQAPYTFHLINGVNTFVEYAETLASQWMIHLELTSKFQDTHKVAQSVDGLGAYLINNLWTLVLTIYKAQKYFSLTTNRWVMRLLNARTRLGFTGNTMKHLTVFL